MSSRKAKKKTSEWEFQGQLGTWLNEEIHARKGMGLDKATQEPSKITGHRSDLIVWRDRKAETALLALELKTPTTPLSNLSFFLDAERKAKAWGAPFFAVWNMQAAELYKTPPPGAAATSADRLRSWPAEPLVKTVDDWLDIKPSQALHKRALEIFDAAWSTGASIISNVTIDASIFVDRLGRRLDAIRAHIAPALSSALAANRAARKQLRAHAAAAGFIGFVDDLNAAVAGQYAYRLVGQILFYFALRRKQPSLPSLVLPPQKALPGALQPYWAEVRKFDYEALFQPSILDTLVPLPPAAQTLIRALVDELGAYDWNELRDDVLGAVFENLIPKHEQVLLGQFYTPPRVADLLIAFAIDGPSPTVLDPGCGSGTFLMRAYDRLRDQTGEIHADLLSRLWGFDISPLAAELAAINLFRQDMSSFNNFPRIVPGSFFDRVAGEEIPFPPARAGAGDKVQIPLPHFSAIIGNPPYLRSQNQDDLDPKYKATLFNTAAKNKVSAATKTDLFAFFVYKALDLMKPGSRLAFVTSASWLTADFAVPLQLLLLDRLRLIAVITSNVESFFSQVDVNTAMLVAELREGPPPANDKLRFVTLKKRLDDLFPRDLGYWSSLVAFADSVEEIETSTESDSLRVTVIDATPERLALINNPTTPRNWSLYLRAPLSFFEIFRGVPA